MRKSIFKPFILLVLLLLYGLSVFAEEPVYDAAFYCRGTWEIENPVLHTYVVFRSDGSYRVYRYEWADPDRKMEDGFVVTLPDPQIVERTQETGHYTVTAEGIRLTTDYVEEGYSPHEGAYRIDNIGLYYRYYLANEESGGDAFISGLAYALDPGTEFVEDKIPLVSMAGARARVVRAAVLRISTRDRIEGEYKTWHYTEFGHLMEVQPGWVVQVLAKNPGTSRQDKVDWYRVVIQMYPQECFWGWISGKNIELLGSDK